MKQVLFIGAGHNFPKGTFAFLRDMKEQEQIHARALFFRPADYATLVADDASTGFIPVMQLEDNEKELIETHKILFGRQCDQQGIRYTIHDNNREWDKDLLVKESRFADLILISGELFYGQYDNKQPNKFLREALHAAECPVLVVPEDYTRLEHLFMAYDGSRESLYAIKQFCYLFPNFIDLPTEMVYTRHETANSIPDVEYLTQFTKLKFDRMSFSKLHFKPEDYFASWISEKQGALLVTGSFGRSTFSYAAKRSFAESVIHDHKLPVFIAHH